MQNKLFTYDSYKAILDLLHKKGYPFKKYHNWQETDRSVILRHDVDNSLEKAVLLSEIEKSALPGGVPATYFVLVSTNFYNIHSLESKLQLRQILQNGGTIGLHFDETQYRITSPKDMLQYVQKEIEILSDSVGEKVDVVSMHRPSEQFLSADMEFPGIINSYSRQYFHQMKYVSDSRRHWREDVHEIIENALYPRLHILTHPFWYAQREAGSLQNALTDAILQAPLHYYDNLNRNFRDLEAEVKRTEIVRLIDRAHALVED